MWLVAWTRGPLLELGAAKPILTRRCSESDCTPQVPDRLSSFIPTTDGMALPDVFILYMAHGVVTDTAQSQAAG